MIYYAQMTGGGYDDGVEIRDTPLHRAFRDGRADWSQFVGTAKVLDVAGNCTQPVIVPKYVGGKMSNDFSYLCRCRECPSCLRARRYLWSIRAQAETLLADRTWMFTGTFARQSHDYEEIKPDVTLFLKRLRERARSRDATIRYSVFPERHKSGALHFHALIHTQSPVTSRLVRGSWDSGFSDCRLADVGSAGYVTKYCTKELLRGSDRDTGEVLKYRPRIRASRSPTYGGWVMLRDLDAVQEVLRSKPREEVRETWRKNLLMILRELKAEESPSARRKLVSAVSYHQAIAS